MDSITAGDDDLRGLSWDLIKNGSESPDYLSYLTDAVMGYSEAPSLTPEDIEDSDNINNTGTVVPMSTTFYPGSHAIGHNLIISSSESVLFYVHTGILTERSRNAFHAILPHVFTQSVNVPSIMFINEPSIVLDVMLHILYGEECSTHNPAFSSVVAALDGMLDFDIDLRDYLVPGKMNYNYILSFAPLHPLELYTLAGHHGLFDLATAVSSHLLSYPLVTIDDATAIRMGAVYLSRLFRLHLVRSRLLRDILLVPPHPHPPTKECSFTDQESVTRAWALVAAHFAWDASPDMSTARIKSAFGSLDVHIPCSECRQTLHDRLKEIVTRWACASYTISL